MRTLGSVSRRGGTGPAGPGAGPIGPGPAGGVPAGQSAAVIILLALGLSLVACLGPGGGPGSSSRRPPSSIPEEDLRGHPLYKVLAPDAIPAIDDPRFVPAAQADFMKDEEPVLGVFHGGVAKAYSLWHLDHHEIVNDTLGRTPIAATW
jgi:hypothetical protein